MPLSFPPEFQPFMASAVAVPAIVVVLKRRLLDKHNERVLRQLHSVNRPGPWVTRAKDSVWGGEVSLLTSGLVCTGILGLGSSLVRSLNFTDPSAQLNLGLAICLLFIALWCYAEHLTASLPAGKTGEREVWNLNLFWFQLRVRERWMDRLRINSFGLGVLLLGLFVLLGRVPRS